MFSAPSLRIMILGGAVVEQTTSNYKVTGFGPRERAFPYYSFCIFFHYSFPVFLSFHLSFFLLSFFASSFLSVFLSILLSFYISFLVSLFPSLFLSFSISFFLYFPLSFFPSFFPLFLPFFLSKTTESLELRRTDIQLG